MAIETPEYAKMMRRMVAAYGRRVADADPEDLAELKALKAEVDAALRVAVRGQHESGRSWSDVARGLGTSKQYVQKAYGEDAA